ncbi:MAG TPA: PEGA domain-containing protein [Granulicella sp.]|jgi:hypothetical protein|nr:PEGA domain-containing protein [Granulicella sp.]
MRRLVAGLLVMVSALGSVAYSQQLASPAPSPAPTPVTPKAPPAPNTLLDGTAVKLRLAENLSSATAKAGQSVPFEVLEEVDVEGVPVIEKGAQALATVTTAEAKKSMGRPGKLDVNIDSVRLIDNEKAALSATQNAKGGGHTGAMTAGMVGTAIVFFPAAPLLLFIHGKDITIPKGTEVTAFVAGDMKLDMAKFSPAASAAAPAAAASGLTIEASVANCDIEVDGSFVGNTPSVLNLAPGKHEIVVKKTGYQDWSRSMMVGGGSVRLSAEMVAK